MTIMFTGEWVDTHGSIDGFYEQWETARLELDKTYVQHPGTWEERHWRIVFIDDKCALGVLVFCKLGPVEESWTPRQLFNLRGWRYADNRPGYRLVREVI